MKAVKTIAALIFLTAIGIVLVQPVLGADDDQPESAGEVVADTETPPLASTDVDLAARYPKRCMRKTGGEPSGLVAARRGSTATIGFPDRAPVARIDVSGDVAWSPSGRFLAESGGRVFDQSGNPQGALFFEPREWQWSPVADCALATTERALTFSIPDTRRKETRLLDVPVEDFELSPNGRRLAVVIEGRGLWIADLGPGRIWQVTRGPASITGWFSNRSVLYSKSPGEGKLRYASGAGRTRIVRGAFAGGAFARCRGNAVLASAGKGSPLSVVESRRGRIRARHLSGVVPPYDGYSDVACSPDGEFVVASAVRLSGEKGALMLHEARDGAFVRELVPGRTANPQWSEDGLMFVKFGKGGDGRLWLIAPGSRPAQTAYRVGAPTQYDWHVR